MDLKGKTLKALAKLNIPVHWNDSLKEDWRNFRLLLAAASERYLYNYKPDEAVMLFTDASKHSWSLVVMQAPYSQVAEQIDLATLIPKPLVFLSGKFNKTQIKWHISQKELYPIVYAHNRLSWLLLGHPGPIYVYTDHANLRNILHPHKTAKTQHLERLRRWALLFQTSPWSFTISQRKRISWPIC